MSIIKKDKIIKNKDLIGFVGGPWTILVYMLNKMSPKRNLKKILSDKPLVIDLIKYVNYFIELHINKQIKSGANVIQIFDSWAGLVKEKDLNEFIYEPTKKLVKSIQSTNTPCICFPRNIKNYYDYTLVKS